MKMSPKGDVVIFSSLLDTTLSLLFGYLAFGLVGQFGNLVWLVY